MLALSSVEIVEHTQTVFSCFGCLTYVHLHLFTYFLCALCAKWHMNPLIYECFWKQTLKIKECGAYSEYSLQIKVGLFGPCKIRSASVIFPVKESVIRENKLIFCSKI